VSPLLVAVLSSMAPQEPPAASPSPAPVEEAAPAPIATEARTVSGSRIEPPRKTKHVPPEWPGNALRAGLDGKVVLECVIGRDGRVQSVKALAGYRSLADSATAAVRKWRYTPTKLEGKPVPVIMTVTVNFRLRDPPKRDDLVDATGDSDPEIRWAAVRWLGRMRPISAKQKARVEAALADPNEQVRAAAREALARLEEP
jgi:TonB family protein